MLVCQSGNVLLDYESQSACKVNDLDLASINTEEGMVLESNGTFLFCGGSQTENNHCKTPNNSEWELTVENMDHALRGAGAFKLDSDKYWIIGGHFDKTSSLIYENGSFRRENDLTFSMSSICTVKINSTLGIICKTISFFSNVYKLR